MSGTKKVYRYYKVVLDSLFDVIGNYIDYEKPKIRCKNIYPVEHEKYHMTHSLYIEIDPLFENKRKRWNVGIFTGETEYDIYHFKVTVFKSTEDDSYYFNYKLDVQNLPYLIFELHNEDTYRYKSKWLSLPSTIRGTDEQVKKFNEALTKLKLNEY